jgi:hypothetical protein
MTDINLDQDHRSKTMAVSKPSILTCVNTSGPDVYTRGIDDDHQYDLRPGESMMVKESTTLIVRIFSTQTGSPQFSAQLSLDNSAAARQAHLDSVQAKLNL